MANRTIQDIDLGGINSPVGATKGFVHMPQIQGNPTGTPNPNPANSIPMVVDKNSGRIWTYTNIGTGVGKWAGTFRFRSVSWSAGVWNRGDAVNYNGDLYVCKSRRTSSNTSNPSADTTGWDRMVEGDKAPPNELPSRRVGYLYSSSTSASDALIWNNLARGIDILPTLGGNINRYKFLRLNDNGTAADWQSISDTVLTEVSTDATLTGKGTSGDVLKVKTPVPAVGSHRSRFLRVNGVGVIEWTTTGIPQKANLDPITPDGDASIGSSNRYAAMNHKHALPAVANNLRRGSVPQVTVSTSKKVLTVIANAESPTWELLSLDGSFDPTNTGINGDALIRTGTQQNQTYTWTTIRGDAVGRDLGTASAGTSSFLSRQDHVHPLPTTAQIEDLISSRLLPSGGTEGQVLKKTSGNDYAVEWGDDLVSSSNGNFSPSIGTGDNFLRGNSTSYGWAQVMWSQIGGTPTIPTAYTGTMSQSDDTSGSAGSGSTYYAIGNHKHPLDEEVSNTHRGNAPEIPSGQGEVHEGKVLTVQSGGASAGWEAPRTGPLPSADEGQILVYCGGLWKPMSPVGGRVPECPAPPVGEN